MDSPPISRLGFRSESGAADPGPSEWRGGRIVIDAVNGSLPRARLTRNGNDLDLAERVTDGSVRLVADWPLSGPGRYHLRFEVDNVLVEETTWTVSSAKLSRDAFRHLMDDLENQLPVTIALALKKLGAAVGIELTPPSGVNSVAEELARLRRTIAKTEYGPGLAAILREIANDPHEVLMDREMWVPATQARRVTPAGLARAAQDESNQSADGIPKRLPDARVQASVDVYENRLLKSFADEVHQRLHRLRSFLETRNEPELKSEVERLGKDIRSARRQAAFLDSVGTLDQVPTRVTMVLIKKPPYRNLLESVLEFRRRNTVRLDDSALETPLEQLPDLYEKWATLVAISAVLELSEELGYEVTRHRLFRQRAMGPWIEVLPDGDTAVELRNLDLDRTVSVIPQRSYSRVGSPLRTISFRQIPDLAIEVRKPKGKCEVYLLDAKYKLDGEAAESGVPDGKPLKADIDKMHAYRDAIRDVDGERVVHLAAILYPGESRFFDSGLAALSALPGADQILCTQIKDLLRPALAD
ncbi:MAG: DUF2357 domain-containing protein [Solirubrobacterales bacterium]